MMLTALIALATALLGLAVGYFSRELSDRLKRVEMATRVLLAREEVKDKESKKMTFADPVKWDELDDQERIELLNP